MQLAKPLAVDLNSKGTNYAPRKRTRCTGHIIRPQQRMSQKLHLTEPE